MKIRTEPHDTCGTCTMCCKLLKVDELDKPQGQWCGHCKVGEGCKIYDRRPESCQTFDCIWLQTQYTDRPYGRELRPDKCHFMLTVASRDPGIVMHVDPARPDAWESPLADAIISRSIESGMLVFVVCGNKRKMIRPTHIPIAKVN